ncbi:MAG: beta-N-acetylglucosaminidase domain-containing protein [Clostridia bacterium]|nr:beta-N-acetylglucosaminidase domain-containing protein [Clostridia bacterium]
MKYSSFEAFGGSIAFPGEYAVEKVCCAAEKDGFVIEVSAEGRATLFVRSERSEFFAKTQAGLWAGSEIACGRYGFEPEFGVRGIIEGFYGNPWSMDERRRLLSVLSAHGMNEYFYGPKDDPFHRDRWDELYGPNDAEVLKTLIQITAENHMDFRYMLALGLSIRYSSPEDRQKLHDKYRQVMSFGVKKFGLLLDDLESAELYPEDAAVYPRQVDAHIDLVNDVYAYIKSLDPEAGLIVCPTQYWGKTNQDYITSLGKGIDPQCEMFYTGPYICSDELTVEFAEGFYENTGHRVIWWDNYPVNDMEMVDELHLRPLTGREKGLGAVCRGLVANPMEYAESSLLSLITVADYLWNSTGYDAEASRMDALKEICPDHVSALRSLGELCYKSCLEREGHHFAFACPKGSNPDFEAAFAEGSYPLWKYLSKCETDLKILRRSGSKLAVECARWIDSAIRFCGSARVLIEKSDGTLLREYLYADEDIMKREAVRLLDRFAK